MREIRIISLRLENFKGVNAAQHDWAGASMEVHGDNGTGKSTLADAAAWCLFGKDMRGRKDFCITPMDNDGNEQHGLTVSVEMWLLVKDEDAPAMTYRLRRSYTEKYSVTPDGGRRLSGHTTKCEVDGAPRKVSEYDQTVADIIGDQTTYRCVTDPAYFCGTMPAENRREMLLRMAGGEQSDQEVARGNADWEKMLAVADKRSLEQLRKDTVAARNKATNEMERTDAAIEQTRKLMPQEKDWGAMEKALEDIRKRQAGIDRELADRDARMKAGQDARLKERARIGEMKSRMQDMEAEQRRKAQEARNAAMEEHDRMASAIRALEKEIAQSRNDLEYQAARSRQTNEYAGEMKKQLDYMRKHWEEENEKQYDGSTVCPTCGQPLPQEMMDKAMATWNTAHAQELESLARMGRDKAEEYQKLTEDLAKSLNQEKEIAGKIDKLMESLDEKRKEYARHMVPQEKPVEQTQEMKDLAAEIQKAEEALAASAEEGSCPAAGLTDERKALEEKAQAVTAELAMREVIRTHMDALERLDHKSTELGQEKARCLWLLDTLASFQREKTRLVEEKVNGMFSTMTFRLYESTLDGAQNSVCVPLVDGVPFDAANSAARMNAGLEAADIIGRSLGVKAPIWIDNAEGNRNIRKTRAQEIRLRVTADPVLTERPVE